MQENLQNHMLLAMKHSFNSSVGRSALYAKFKGKLVDKIRCYVYITVQNHNHRIYDRMMEENFFSKIGCETNRVIGCKRYSISNFL